MVRVAINGYGRIGRLAHRILIDQYDKYAQVVAINAGSSTDVQGWMYLLKYDTVYGIFPHEIKVEEIASPAGRDRNDEGEIGSFVINGKTIPVYSQKDPSLLPWNGLGVDVVIESTGHFRKKEDLEKHLKAGAKKVVLSAPAKDEIQTVVLSVNDEDYTGEDIISNASCTTNCIAPVAKIMQDNFGIEKAMMTTIHGYTSDQRLQDGGHKDYRRARAAAQNIIPTSTGATGAMTKTIPQLKDKFTGLAIRVPVPVGSLSDCTFVIGKQTSIEKVNEVFKKESQSEQFKGILSVTTDPIVSSDIIGNPHSAVVDLSLTQVVGGNMVKVIAWYDNEFGYANRLVEEAIMMGTLK